jgi:1,4-dihydroxy-2-naphthoyl-CoA hydrolase
VHNDAWYEAMPLAGKLGMELVTAEREEVRARLAWAPELCTAGGLLHGGAIMALADGAAGTCAFLNLPDGAAGTATIQSATSFMRPVSSGHVEAVSRPLRVGRTVIHVETDVLDAEDRLVARVTQAQAVL